MSNQNLVLNNTNADEHSLSKQVCALAGHTFRLAASALFGAPETANMDEVLRIGLERASISNSTVDNNLTGAPMRIPTSCPFEYEDSIASSSISDPSSSVFSCMSITPDSEEVEEETTSSEELAVPESNDSDLLEIIPMAEVKLHYNIDDAWMIVYDRVYDVTDFLREHPGGSEVMQDYLGYDATIAFRSVGHSCDALEMLDQYLIGILPKKERLYDNRDRW